MVSYSFPFTLLILIDFHWCDAFKHFFFFWMFYIKSSCVMLPLIWLVLLLFSFLGILVELFFKKITMSFTCKFVNHPWSDHYLVFFLCKFPMPFFLSTLSWIYLSKNSLEFLACQIRILWWLQLMLKYFRNLLVHAILWYLQL